MIKLTNVSKSFGEKKIINNVNFIANPGEIIGLLGKNGAGKTTLFKCMLGDIDYSGNIEISDDLIKHSYFVPDTPYTYDFLTGLEQIKFTLELNKIKFSDVKDQIFELIKGFDLEKSINVLQRNYSFGMKRKIALISAIIIRPKFLILDEPVNGLDAPSIIFFKKVLRENLKDSVIIVSSHIIDLVSNLCTSLAIIHERKFSHYSQKELLELESIEEEYLKIISSKSC